MHHQRHAHRFKTAPSQLRAVCRRGGGHRVAVNMGEIYPSLLKDTAVTQYPAAPAATRVALPAIFNKISAINGG